MLITFNRAVHISKEKAFERVLKIEKEKSFHHINEIYKQHHTAEKMIKHGTVPPTYSKS